MTEYKGFVPPMRADVEQTARSIGWRLSPEAKQVREELLDIDSSVDMDYNSPPRRLQFSAGGKKYFSVRTIEGTNISHYDDSRDRDPVTVFEVDAKLIPDQAIGVLVVPDWLEPSPEGDKKYGLSEKYDSWIFERSWGTIPYDPKDWQIESATIVLVKRIGNKFYRLGKPMPEHSKGYDWDRFDKKDLLNELKPDTNGKIRVLNYHFLDDADAEVKREWGEPRTRFYVLVEGSGEGMRVRERGNAPAGKLVTEPTI